MNTKNGMERCAKECLACYQACVQTLQHCLSKGGRHAGKEHVTLMADCVEICRTSADLLLRGSERHAVTCRACAEICRECAEDCRSFENDREMAACADACERCAESCDKMAAVSR